MVDPCRPGFQPGLVAPVAIRISAALQAFNVIDKLFFTVVTKLVRNPIIVRLAVSLTAACAHERGAAFFTCGCTTGAFNEIFDRPLFASAEDRLFFQLGAVTLVAYGNDIGHGNPGGINHALKLEIYSTAPNDMSIGNGAGSGAFLNECVVRLVNPRRP